jgi:hypothetical protein
MASLALSAGTKFNENPLIKNSENEEIKKLRISFKSYFTTFNGIMTQFEEIANKEIKDEKLTSKEIIFLQQFYSTVGCGSDDGIYGSLFFSGADEMSAKDFIVADVHTQPTDEAGDMIGKIFHVGTGQINLGVVIAKNNSGEATAFVGPFMSYYEYFSLNFDRLTDEEWRETYLAANALRHPLVDLYLADMDGNSRSANPVSLPIMTDFVTPPALYNNIGITAYPNPAVDKVFIAFNIPQNFLNNKVKLEIFDTNGNLIRKLFEGSLLDRNYLARWDGEDSSGRKMAAGIYIYQLLVNNNILSGKILFGK